MRYMWLPGENIADTEVTEDNDAGFYALKTPEAVFWYFFSPHHQMRIDIVGEVLLYGTVIEGEKGYRASRAEVGTLLLPTVTRINPLLVDSICRRYKVGTAVLEGYSRRVMETYRRLLARKYNPYIQRARRCSAGAREIARLRRDEFLL